MTEAATSPRTGHETCHHRIYRLSCSEYEELRARAARRCERCGIAEQETRRRLLVIDHNPRAVDADNAVRGLTCDPCNAHLGLVDAGRRPLDEATAKYLADPWSRRYEAARAEGTRRFRRSPRKIGPWG